MKTLAGVALAALAVAGPPRDATADVVNIKVEIDADCVAKMSPQYPAVSERRQDVVLWSIVSNCRTPPQKVHVCVKKDDPFDKCVGLPPAKFGKSFGGTTPARPTYIMCGIDWSVLKNKKCTPKKDCPMFPLRAFSGPENTKVECPGRCKAATPAKTASREDGGRFGSLPADPDDEESETEYRPCLRSELALEVEP